MSPQKLQKLNIIMTVTVCHSSAFYLVFAARRYASAVYIVVVCLSLCLGLCVCLCVSLSVTLR